jgi:hypothetical protein
MFLDPRRGAPDLIEVNGLVVAGSTGTTGGRSTTVGDDPGLRSSTAAPDCSLVGALLQAASAARITMFRPSRPNRNRFMARSP